MLPIKGGPLWGERSDGSLFPKDIDGLESPRQALNVFSREGWDDGSYFDAVQALTAAEHRKLWLAEGKQRGYVLVDDDGGRT